MRLQFGIIIGIVLLTTAAAGGWVYMNQDKVYGGKGEEVAAADPAPEDSTDYPTAERNLGRLSRHFHSAPPPKEKKSGWGLW